MMDHALISLLELALNSQFVQRPWRSLQGDHSIGKKSRGNKFKLLNIPCNYGFFRIFLLFIYLYLSTGYVMIII